MFKVPLPFPVDTGNHRQLMAKFRNEKKTPVRVEPVKAAEAFASCVLNLCELGQADACARSKCGRVASTVREARITRLCAWLLADQAVSFFATSFSEITHARA
eukprot:COSAG06_NODE_18501_length_884_cov_3.015287_1_plen_102_part_10